MNEKLYYITDTYGCFYAVNSMSKLVPVNNEELATKFTLAKANNVISNMIKPMQRYQFILKEVPSDNDRKGDYLDLEKSDYKETRFDEMNTDWIWYVQDMISFSSQLKQYQINLNHMLSEVDKEICDIMHYIEFYNLDAAKGYKMYKMLRDCRLRRRKIKDEHEKVTFAIQAFGNNELLDKMKLCLRQMKGLDTRSYTPRVLTELFDEAS